MTAQVCEMMSSETRVTSQQLLRAHPHPGHVTRLKTTNQRWLQARPSSLGAVCVSPPVSATSPVCVYYVISFWCPRTQSPLIPFYMKVCRRFPEVCLKATQSVKRVCGNAPIMKNITVGDQQVTDNVVRHSILTITALHWKVYTQR